MLKVRYVEDLVVDKQPQVFCLVVVCDLLELHEFLRRDVLSY